MRHSWTRCRKVMIFCLFPSIAILIGAVIYITDSLTEKLGLLALLVAYGGLVMVFANQIQDAEDKRARHDKIVELVKEDIAVHREGNRLLGNLIDIQEKHGSDPHTR